MTSNLPASPTAGVKPMSIEGRCKNVRERLIQMSAEDRKWRAQWLKDQHLAPNEPRYVPEYFKEITNPIRRFYKWPLNTLFEKLQPVMGVRGAFIARWYTGKMLMFLGAVYAGHYYFKYNRNDWTRRGGWKVHVSRQSVLPGEEGYPNTGDRTHPWDYYDRGFKDRKVFTGGLY